MVSVLFVCLGNICRSPTAEGVFTKLVSDHGHDSWIRIDSAGTHAYHVGSSPDRRAQKAALNRGVDLSNLRGRQVSREDFDDFDYILAMDHENYHNLLAMSPSSHHDKISLFLSHAENVDTIEVPDPYYGGDKGFEHVLDLVEDASRGLLEKILSKNEA